MVPFACLVSFVAAIPYTKTNNFFPNEGAWQNYPQQGSPWTNVPQQGSHWKNFPQQGSPWDNPQQGSPWDNPQQGSPWDNPQQGSPWDNPQQGSPWDNPQQGSPWDNPQQGSPWDNPQQENPWEEYPHHDPKPKPENPQHGSPAPENRFDINDMLMQVNRVRAKAGARALRINDKLMTAAQSHSQDQANTRQMSHTGSDGSDIATRATRAQYKYRAIGENVAYNQRTVSEVMTSWINSPGHYANLISTDFQDFGAGMVGYYWTQNFGSSQ